jgi:hypothetical protein
MKTHVLFFAVTLAAQPNLGGYPFAERKSRCRFTKKRIETQLEPAEDGFRQRKSLFLFLM